MHFTEDDFENAILELFREQLGYDYVYSPNVIRDYAEPLYVEALEAVLPQINRGLPQAAIDEAMVKIRTYEGGILAKWRSCQLFRWPRAMLCKCPACRLRFTVT